jgi:hypothetical protein
MTAHAHHQPGNQDQHAMPHAHHPFRARSTAALCLAILLLAAGCSGGGGDGSSSGGAVTLTYPSGRIMATGHYEPGTTIRTGEWREYFDQDGSPQQWRRSYTAGAWDRSRDWREWNADASVRNDASDR